MKRIHFAEELNEYNHLLIMESMGGDEKWQTRFFARHAAFTYFFVLVGLWLLSPRWAYNFSELIEAHAVDTYTEFHEANKESLVRIPAPKVAADYYMAQDMYLFDEFQSELKGEPRRPKIENMYDVFVNIAKDEGSHVSTMHACQNGIARSPDEEAANIIIYDILFVSFIIGSYILSSSGIALDGDLVETALGVLRSFLSADTPVEELTDGVPGVVESLQPLYSVAVERLLNIFSKLR